MTKDQFENQGGSYLIDSTGKKTLVHRTEEKLPSANKEDKVVLETHKKKKK